MKDARNWISALLLMCLALAGMASTSALAAVTISLTSPTANQVFTAPASVTLTASTSGTGIAKVEFYQGSTLLGSKTASPYTYSWTSVGSGSYSLKAVAKNWAGTVLATSAVVPIIVNALPTVSITSPTANQMFATSTNVTITANAADSDGTVSKVDFYRGTTLVGTATAAPYSVTWSNVTTGSYSLTAKATDNRGAVTTSAAVPIIVNAWPTVSITSPTISQVFATGTNVTITANAADSDGTVSKVDFYSNGGAILIGTATAAPYSVTWSNVATGTYILTAQATDNRGAVMASAPVAVVVAVAPTVSLTSPTANQMFAALSQSAPVTLTATASAGVGGTVADVEFYQGTTLIGTATSAPYTLTWNNVPAGNYSLTAKATDSRGLTSTSSAVPITVVGINQNDFYSQIEAEAADGSSIPGCNLHLVQYWDPSKQPPGGYHQMVYIHGGGWVGNSWLDPMPYEGFNLVPLSTVNDNILLSINNQTTTPYLDSPMVYFVEQGFIVSSIEYRLLYMPGGDYTSQEGRCGLATTTDLKRDVDQMVRSAVVINMLGLNGLTAQNLDNERVLVMGSSAGAHLAVWFANQLSQDDRKKVAVVSDSGPLDFLDYWLQANSKGNRYNDLSKLPSDDSYYINPLYKGRTLSVGSRVQSSTFAGKDITAGDSGIWSWALGVWVCDAVNPRTVFQNPVLDYDALCSNTFRNLTPATLDNEKVTPDASGLASVLLDNTFRLKTNLKNPDGTSVVVPPTYLLVGANDGVVPPEQSIAYCESLGTPAIIQDIDHHDVSSPEDHTSFNCGINNGSTYRLDVMLNGGHGNQSPNVFGRITDWFLGNNGESGVKTPAP